MQKEHFEILLESMDSKIDLILEGFSVLNKKNEDEGTKRKEENELLNVKITALSNRVSSVETNLNSKIDSVETNLNSRIDSVETNLAARIDAVHSELIDHRNSSEMHKVPRKRVIRKAA